VAGKSGGEFIARILKEQDVKYLFTVHGGHILPLLAFLREYGIEMIHVRHEQAAAHAADAWARTTGTPGVLSVTAGCGLTNAVTGLSVAAHVGSPVVCISGQHPTNEDGRGSFQESYGSEICRSFCKYTKRVIDWSTIEADVRGAFREAAIAPEGPALVEVPINILYATGEEAKQQRGAKMYSPDELRPAGNPARIENAWELLRGAKRPLLVAGDGVFWSNAWPEIRELSRRWKIPVYSRRAGQGALPEDDELAIRGAWKKPFTGTADVVLVIGFKFWAGERFGSAPAWNENAVYIHVDSVPSRIGRNVPADLAIVGDPKLVLRQMIETGSRIDPASSGKAHSAWLEQVAEVRVKYQQMLAGRASKTRENLPIHPERLISDLVSVIDRDASVIIDSFTLSGWMNQYFKAHFPGQVLDSGPLAPVGHGVAMAIGAQLARPGKQVIALVGDGGIGIGGMEMETALRYRLPITVVLWNNGCWGPAYEDWGPGFEKQYAFLAGRLQTLAEEFRITPARYDRCFEALGCHGEFVERPEQIIPALERALRAGKPSLLNVVGDSTAGHPGLTGTLGPAEIKA
jgi:acetolactate synthase-1/2/3 large subunit